MNQLITVLGGTGFVGGHLVAALRQRGVVHWVPERESPEIFRKPLGIVYYCVGLTADFRQHPYETIDAHVYLLRKLLERADYDAIVYLSSTRVYAGCEIAQESTPLLVRPDLPDQLYNLSKLLGENLTLTAAKNGRVARLSNVLGPKMGVNNFIGSVLDEARRTGHVQFHTSLGSSKDYIWIDDVVEALLCMAKPNVEDIINVATGINTTHVEIANWLHGYGISTAVSPEAPVSNFPSIRIDRLRSLTGRTPSLPIFHLDRFVSDSNFFNNILPRSV